jgi:hypothetical protein
MGFHSRRALYRSQSILHGECVAKYCHGRSPAYTAIAAGLEARADFALATTTTHDIQSRKLVSITCVSLLTVANSDIALSLRAATASVHSLNLTRTTPPGPLQQLVSGRIRSAQLA